MNLATTASKTSNVTVVVSCYNHQAYIEQCLESVAAQTVQAQQVIVIDDASSDESADVIRRWIARSGLDYTFIHHSQNRGVCATLNEALALAVGEYFVHVSGDDWEEPDRLETQERAFKKASSDVAFIIGDIREVDVAGATIVDHDFGLRLGDLLDEGSGAELLPRLLNENVIPAPGVIIRTDVVREVGGYDETLAFEDYDLWLRLASTHSLGYAPGVVANYRVITSSLTRNTARRAAVLTSEAIMLSKHIGSGASNDAIVAHRLLRIAGDLVDIEAATSVGEVLGYAASASAEPWIRSASKQALTRGGLAKIRTAHHRELGITSAQPTAA